MTPEALVRTVEDFLSGARDAVVLEDGAVAFDLAQAKYSISGERNKCLLHLWSAERNVVRRVVDLEVKNEVLQLAVQRLGQSRPTKLEICRQRDRRTPTAKRAARLAYQRLLQRVLARKFLGFKVDKLSTSMDLERSFGPIYARGLMRQGQSAFAVLGVNAQETQASIDASLTFGILWLDVCRQAQAGKAVVQGLKLFVPKGSSSLIRERIANLNRDAAKWQLYEIDEREDSAKETDTSDRGNVTTRLVHCADERAARERFAQAIAHVRDLMPESEFALISPAEMTFRCHGLEFARARLTQEPGSFRSTPEIVFGVGAAETTLRPENAESFARLVRSIGEVRHAGGPRDHLLWRLHPERWLESLVIKNVTALDERFDAGRLYSQVPAFSASDRAMIDVLTTTREGRLAVIELKADEDIHLPLQGLDYWSRVAWHHARGEFHRCGYFSAKELSPEPPLLLLVAPALHVHPATDTLLRYISPEIEWTLAAIDERWRDGVRVVFRKRSNAPSDSNYYLSGHAPSSLRTSTS
ncbi:MAG TPA: hypothetical protein VGU64_15595 [Terriglobales bacterium]|nr:hypothetical protein [Terriglobales bacterium]